MKQQDQKVNQVKVTSIFITGIFHKVLFIESFIATQSHDKGPEIFMTSHQTSEALTSLCFPSKAGFDASPVAVGRGSATSAWSAVVQSGVLLADV